MKDREESIRLLWSIICLQVFAHYIQALTLCAHKCLHSMMKFAQRYRIHICNPLDVNVMTTKHWPEELSNNCPLNVDMVSSSCSNI